MCAPKLCFQSFSACPLVRMGFFVAGRLATGPARLVNKEVFNGAD
ncbi:hypothetical protein SAMN05661003_11921 [Desulfuromonas thiophila]|uniref:Uncharacterized protein n=1 Tax=Desulfuromonas thiophila TaxID=57664 RepID=A0A1G7EBQ4_9BACT|nr:hypothetical protein SAMN05661003_11921 [Desulfuromonas thiophila]